MYLKGGRATSINLGDIAAIDHRQSFGDIIEIESGSSDFMSIETAPLNQGETFVKVLRRNWERSRTNR